MERTANPWYKPSTFIQGVLVRSDKKIHLYLIPFIMLGYLIQGFLSSLATDSVPASALFNGKAVGWILGIYFFGCVVLYAATSIFALAFNKISKGLFKGDGSVARIRVALLSAYAICFPLSLAILGLQLWFNYDYLSITNCSLVALTAIFALYTQLKSLSMACKFSKLHAFLSSILAGLLILLLLAAIVGIMLFFSSFIK
ncbi:MAG: hypothetical protein H7A39_03590 [Chlamydiales bacterium]|nr:hypothetical protein [Chlamydiales bacterium]